MLPLLLRERPQDVVALEPIARLVQRQQRRALGGRRLGGGVRVAVQERQIGGGNGVARHHDHQPLDQIPQLADVARPRVAAAAAPSAASSNAFGRRPYSCAKVAMK